MFISIGMIFYLFIATTLIFLAALLKGVRSLTGALLNIKKIFAWAVGSIILYLLVRFGYEYYREQYGFFEMLLNDVLAIVTGIIIAALGCGAYFALSLITCPLENLGAKCEWKATNLLVKTDALARKR